MCVRERDRKDTLVPDREIIRVRVCVCVFVHSCVCAYKSKKKIVFN